MTESGEQSPIPQTAEEIRAACEAIAAAEADELAAAGKGLAGGSGGNGHGPIDYRFLKSCLDSNELGDGVLFAALHAGKFIFNASGQQWMRWTGHHWEVDVEERCLAAVESVAGNYLGMLTDIAKRMQKHAGDKEKIKRLEKLQGKVLKRVSRLRADRGRKNCLKLAASNQDAALVTREDAFDVNPWLLPCANAVVDLRTGEAVEPRPEDMLLMAAPTEWHGLTCPAPIWERFLREVFVGDEEMLGFIQRLLGYAITGSVKDHILPIFVGVGRNGKGTIFETLHHVLGELAQPIQAEMLLDNGQNRSSAAPSADIMGLKGLRIAYASENDQNRRFSLARVKWFSGGDTLKGRRPNDKHEITFAPTHKLFLGTNDIPTAISDDFAFWQRVKVVRFGLSFVDEPAAENERKADKDLPEALKAEAPGILAWLVRGCLEWQRTGLATPLAVKMATEEQRASDDIYQDWIDECLVLDKHAETNSSKLYFSFVFWYEQMVGKKRVPSQNRWGKVMAKRFKREKHGTFIYYGIDVAPLPFCPHCGVENLPSAPKCHKCQKPLDDGDIFDRGK